MKIISKFVLLILLSCIVCSSFAAEAEDAPVAATGTPAGAPQEVADAIAQQELVNQLAAYAEANNDALAYIVAASIASRITGGASQSKAAKNSKAFSDQPGASSQLLNKAKEMAGSDETLSKLIAGAGSSSSKAYPTTCYAENDLGGWFYWTGPSRASARNSVMSLCRASTPYGAWCYHAGCD